MPQTPAARPTTRPARSRRRVRIEQDFSDDDEVSPASVVPTGHHTVKSRSQRASKTAALTKMSSCTAPAMENHEIEDELEEESDVTSEDSDESE